MQDKLLVFLPGKMSSSARRVQSAMAFWTQCTRNGLQSWLFRQLYRLGASQESSLSFSRDLCDDAAWTYSAVIVLQGYTNPTGMQSAIIFSTRCDGMTLDRSCMPHMTAQCGHTPLLHTADIKCF